MTIDSVGGYRLVRKLGEGARALVFLGHPDRAVDDAPSVAIKVYRPEVPEESVSAEIEALSRAVGPFSVTLLDVTATPEGQFALILQRCAKGSLTRLLRECLQLRPGELVTILAPLTTAIVRLQGAGIAHGNLRPQSVLFDHLGTPTLACFGASRLVLAGMPQAQRESDEQLRGDREALRRLMTSLVTRSVAADSSFARWLGSHEEPASPQWLDGLSERLFDFAEPMPIDFSAARSSTTHPVPGRMAGESSKRASGSAAKVRRSVARSQASHVTPRRAPTLAGVVDGFGALQSMVREVLAGVRKRYWVAAVAAVLAAGSATVLLQTVPRPSDAAVASDPAPVRSTEPQVSQDDPAIGGRDPIAAAVALLELRSECVRQVSVTCLARVDQAGSAAEHDDRALILEMQNGAGSTRIWSFEPEEMILIDALGGSALIGLGEPQNEQPASLLLMQGEAGWRIRDYQRG